MGANPTRRERTAWYRDLSGARPLAELHDTTAACVGLVGFVGVKRSIGSAQQGCRRAAVTRIHGNARADREARLVGVGVQPLVRALHDEFGAFVVRVRQDRHELVATITGWCV